MAKQNVKVELFYDSAWHDLAAADQVLADTEIVITRGGKTDLQAPTPSSISLRLNNKDDRFRTTNPMSPLYGKAGVNVPLRVSVGTAVRGHAEASSWTCDQTTDFRRSPLRGVAWTDVQAGGLLQRVARWTRQVKSPLRLATEGLAGVVGYWPMEDDSGSSTATSVVDGSQFSTTGGLSFGSQLSPPGGGTAVDVGANPSTTFVFLPGDPASTAGWQLNRVIYLNKLTGGGTIDPVLGVQLRNAWNLFMQVDGDTGTVWLRATDNQGNGKITTSATDASYRWLGRWIMVHMQATYSAGTTTVGVYWRGIDDPDWETFSGTWTGPTSSLYYCGPLLPEGSAFGHMVGTSGTAAPLTSGARFEAFGGHDDERSSYRHARLCDENNLPYYVSGSYNDSIHLGPQGADTLANLFQENQNTEDALIYDHRTDLRIQFLSRQDRQNQTPALTLTVTANPSGLPSLPAEVSDDVPIMNIVTAKQRGGGDFTARDDTSPMGTADPPVGRGEYKQDVPVNLHDPGNYLAQMANWWMRRGTVDKPRFPAVTVDLGSLGPAKIAEVEAVDIGDVIEIVGYREYTIRVYVLGTVEKIGTHTRSITFTCMPDQQFNIGVLDTNRLQAKYTAMNASLTTTATTLVFVSGDDSERWRAGVSDVHILLDGEEIALGTIGARAGTNPYTWTITGCTRSVNGIVKTHGAGAIPKVKDTIRLGLKEAS